MSEPKPFIVALPLTVQTVRIENVLDLRVPSVADWFSQRLSDLRWNSAGGQFAAFPNKRTLSCFEELVPSLFNQALGGGYGTLSIAGVWLRKLKIDALVFPSARSDVSVAVQSGEVQSSCGWNLVDYRGTNLKPLGFQVEEHPDWPNRIQSQRGPISELPHSCIQVMTLLRKTIR